MSDPILDGIVGAGESVSKFAPDRFRASVTNNLGMASQSRFEVEFPNISGMTSVSGKNINDKSTSDDRNLFCAAAGMPGRQISVMARGIGIENHQIANGHTMPEVTFTWYLTNTYVMKEYFENWMDCITGRDAEKAQHVGYYRNYVKKVTVRQYTRAARRGYTIDLIDAYPTNVQTIELNSQLQTAPMEMSVTMTYRTYEKEQDKDSILDIF
jgi:hypothetical protein